MPCLEILKIQSIAEAAREQLRGRETNVNASETDELFPASWERAARTALFSAEIDAAVHKSRCDECGGVVARTTEMDIAANPLSNAA